MLGEQNMERQASFDTFKTFQKIRFANPVLRTARLLAGSFLKKSTNTQIPEF